MYGDPLDIIARLNSPFESGEMMWNPTETPPELMPKIVTDFGSPPNDAMLFCI